DDGGSSGRLRREFDMLAPGDIRNCLVAMSADEALLSKVFQYRFASGQGLKGHTLGNLFLTAMTELSGGDFARAVQHASDVLATCGQIYPATVEKVVLEALLENGKIIQGETKISRSKSRIRRVRLKPARPKPLPETLEAIASADLITMGPGSLFTSVIPNLLVRGIGDAIAESGALKAHFVNLMWQPGETIQFTASDHVRAINDHARRRIVDVVVVNSKPIPVTLQEKYAASRAHPVENDIERLSGMGVRVLSRELAAGEGNVRHDSGALARIAVELALASRRGLSRALTA
ncbi:MAG: uridine diphosphate-N-acetylglucosamine-binding protein YvcK, partial [Bryobacteraceae bacterium]|nr:uridine diphosphate-N-acetylglucosamine-binding protein YvcK [Bryobacteraceae bacterium]